MGVWVGACSRVCVWVGACSCVGVWVGACSRVCVWVGACSRVGRCVFAGVCVGGPVAKPFPIVDALRAGNQDGAELIG